MQNFKERDSIVRRRGGPSKIGSSFCIHRSAAHRLPKERWQRPGRRSEEHHAGFSGKEVIQPQVPLRLPCYDLVPIAEFILGAWLLAVTSATSDAPHFRGLTGGVYKAQEHIHRGMLTRDY